jgi:hypothetical protein
MDRLPCDAHIVALPVAIATGTIRTDKLIGYKRNVHRLVTGCRESESKNDPFECLPKRKMTGQRPRVPTHENREYLVLNMRTLW